MSDSFNNLPRITQKRIDKAFDALALSTPSNPHVGIDQDTAGGFIVDPGLSGHVPLSLVPDALRSLNLPPDDDQILSVFRNAASGWSSATNSVDKSRAFADGLVTRDDWRSVCAVLLEHENDQGSNEDSIGEDDDNSEGSDYASGGGSEESDEDYQEEAIPTTRSRGSRTRRTGSGPGDREEHTLTQKQQEACLETYSLFFPSIPLADLPNKNIMIKDIQRVAKLLGEKLAADEIIEMLETFSSSPDKSVSLADFSRMMVAAKLI